MFRKISLLLVLLVFSLNNAMEQIQVQTSQEKPPLNQPYSLQVYALASVVFNDLPVEDLAQQLQDRIAALEPIKKIKVMSIDAMIVGNDFLCNYTYSMDPMELLEKIEKNEKPIVLEAAFRIIELKEMRDIMEKVKQRYKRNYTE